MAHAVAPEASTGLIAPLVSRSADERGDPADGRRPERGAAWIPRRQDRGQFQDSLRLPAERHADAASQSPGSGDGNSPGRRQAWARRESSYAARDALRDPREIP